MTSGEWDLRALRALEEEELAQFQAISEPEQIQIPPPPQLPTIDEFEFGIGLEESLPSSPLIPLPPGLLSKYSGSGSGSGSVGGGGTRSCGGGGVSSITLSSSIAGTPPSVSTGCCSSTSSRGSGSGSGGGGSGSFRKLHKIHQRHHFPCKGKNITEDCHSNSSISTVIIGEGTPPPPPTLLSSSTLGTTILDSLTGNGSEPTTNQDMMTMMMFLSSTAPPEVTSPTVTGGGTTSLLCTGTSNSSCNHSKTADDDDDDNCCGGDTIGNGSSVVGFSSFRRCSSTKKSTGCKVSSKTTGKTSSADIIDYELEDHIKHCSCSCNHMGYGNSMDYQTTGFGGGLPDVTEHSNIRRTTTRQDSASNSESADVTSLQKSKKPIKTRASKRKYCIFSLSIITTLILCAIISILAYQFYVLTPNRNSHDQRLKIVRKILREVPLVDGHNDLAWNVRKYAHSSLELLDLNQELEHKTISHRPTWSQTDIPRLRQGLLGAQIWSAYVPCEAQGLDAVQLALEQIDIIHRFTELYPKELALVVSSQEILQAHRQGMLASLIGIEGGHALGSSLGVLRSMHSLGARYLTLTHQCDTSWAGSSSMSMEKGLSAFGKAVIKEMNRLGMMIDLSHSSDATARDVLDVTRAPIIFSHSAARSLCNSTRNIPDDILRAVADNGGLIMISFDSQHVGCDDTSTLHDVVAHIKYIRSIAGIQHIGIGAGYDSIESPPIGLENVSKYPNLLASLLEDPNWSEDDIAMLAGKNFLRVLKSVENVRDYWKRAAIPPVEISEPVKKSQCTYMSS